VQKLMEGVQHARVHMQTQSTPATRVALALVLQHIDQMVVSPQRVLSYQADLPQRLTTEAASYGPAGSLNAYATLLPVSVGTLRT